MVSVFCSFRNSHHHRHHLLRFFSVEFAALFQFIRQQRNLFHHFSINDRMNWQSLANALVATGFNEAPPTQQLQRFYRNMNAITFDEFLTIVIHFRPRM
jgi:hypothetical protein